MPQSEVILHCRAPRPGTARRRGVLLGTTPAMRRLGDYLAVNAVCICILLALIPLAIYALALHSVV